MFVFIEPCQSQWYSNWTYRKIISNNPAAGGDLTNFPLLVTISNDTDLASYASNNGHDIVFTLGVNSNKLCHEIEYYDSGTLVAWVKVPYFSSSVQASNNLFMYFDKTKSGDQQNAAAVWDANYKGVWHLSQDPLGTAPQMLDSTVNARHGSVNSTPAGNLPVRVAGQTGYGLEFSDESEGKSNWVEIPLMDFPELTVELWGMRYDVDAAFGDGFFGGRRWNANPNLREGYDLMIGAGANNVSISYNAVVTNNTTTNDQNQIFNIGAEINTWHNMAGTVDLVNSTKIFFVDSIQADSDAIAAGSAVKSYTYQSYLCIGRSYVNQGYLSGRVDEVRISDKPRSSNWLATCHSNMKQSAAFHTLGSCETNPGVIFNFISQNTPFGVAGESISINLNAFVIVNTINNVSIDWGDGNISTAAPDIMDISSEEYTHIYSARSNYVLKAAATSSSGSAATNSNIIIILPYRMHAVQNLSFSHAEKGFLISWQIQSHANVDHYNLYRENMLHAKIYNPALREYLDDRVIFGDRYSYWMETVYHAGSIFSSTNTSASHSVYRREKDIGTGGGSVATLFAELEVPRGALSATSCISMTILSNGNFSFYDTGKPVYHQIELAGSDLADKIKGAWTLKFRIPVTNNLLNFKPYNETGFSIAQKDLFCIAGWNGKTWSPISTVSFIDRRENNFSFLILENSLNQTGIYGVMCNRENTVNETVSVKNRVFLPENNNKNTTHVQISFPNPERKDVKVEIFNQNGRLVRIDNYYEWISFYSWDGKNNTGAIEKSGLYIVSICVSGRLQGKAYNTHVYLMR
ncbi:MAG: hypothetical protein A2096_13675 [Spirochaetes bacterium GWF1_41_5]|nr:MAG: hypothetical protein A2096_13675 [Spirochaetes bacterium GWF1_41_5]